MVITGVLDNALYTVCKKRTLHPKINGKPKTSEDYMCKLENQNINYNIPLLHMPM